MADSNEPTAASTHIQEEEMQSPVSMLAGTRSQTQKLLESMSSATVPSPLMSSVASGSEDIPKDKESIIEFAETYSIDLASERFSIPKSTLKSWLKHNKIPIKPIYNSPGQGRKISYSQELDNQIADHIRSLLDNGERVSIQDLCSYARSLIQKENSDFTASTGWAQRFLTRHNIDLSNQVKRLIPSNRQPSNSLSSLSDARGRPLSYSAEVDNSIASWVRQRTDRGDIVTNSELRRYAKDVISKENHNFTGSASWAQNFLLRHRLSLQPSFLSSETDKDVPISSASTSEEISIQEVASSAQSGMLSSQSNLSASPIEDSVSSTLALLAGDAMPVETQLSQAGLSLSDLTSDVALADLLSSAQDPTGTAFSSTSLETSAAYLNLGQHLSELVGSVTAAASGQNVLDLSQSQPLSSTTPISSASGNEGVGSGTRPLSYTKETDQILANWVKEQQSEGQKVTFASLRSYAKKLVSPENPNFNASVGWVTPFLLRHNLDLKVNDRKIRPTRKTTNPRKLSSKDDQGAEEEEQPAESQSEGGAPIDENEIEISPLAVVSSLTESFPTATQSIQVTSEGLSIVTPPSEIAVATQVTADEFVTPSSKPYRPGSRSRHTLAEKLEVVRLMRQMNLAGHYISRLLGIATSTLSGWVKLVDQKGAELEALSTNRKRSNRSGQGRPLTYSREKDELIADWVRQQQEVGVPVTATDLSTHASTLIGQENPNFVASVGWRHKFLQRHNLHLQQLHASYSKASSSDDQQSVPLPVQTEEVCTDDYSVGVIEKIYPDEVVRQLVEWTKRKVAENGSVAVQQFCKQAEELLLPLDAMFVATLGWAFKFLHTHGLFLDPKPVNVEVNRKRTSSSSPLTSSEEKKARTMGMAPESMTVSPSTGNLCEALLSLSSQPGDGEESSVVMETSSMEATLEHASASANGNTKTYFGKAAREFSSEEKEEVVRYANATTLQKAALKYGVAAPTVWRWRMELKLHQPKYTANQKKYIVKFAETNSLKEASQRFGITTKTIQNWRRALQLDGTLSDVEIAAIPPPSLQDMVGEGEGLTTAATSTLMTEEVIPLDNSHFQYVVDGGEVAEGTRIQGHTPLGATPSSSLEVTHEVQVQDVGMEYDVISSEGHAAKPRCTPEEKTHILQYALEHSIREASIKYGVSPGTLYYWKKNRMAAQQAKNGNAKLKTSLVAMDDPTGCSLETTVVSVPMPLDILTGTQGLIQSHTPGATDPLQALAGDTGILSDPHAGIPTSNLINAITQTLASATPEQLQSLQQITSDLNLLQAVTSLINSHESAQLRQATPTEGQRESLSGGISSPTDVLVSFNPLTTPTNQTEIVAETVEDVAMAMSEEEVLPLMESGGDKTIETDLNHEA